MFLCLFGLVKFGLKGQQPIAQGNALSKMGWFDCFALKGQKHCWDRIAFDSSGRFPSLFRRTRALPCVISSLVFRAACWANDHYFLQLNKLPIPQNTDAIIAIINIAPIVTRIYCPIIPRKLSDSTIVFPPLPTSRWISLGVVSFIL